MEKNVYDSALERIEFIFKEFDNVCFSISGGKDSSVMVQLANKVAQKMNLFYDCLYIDLEGQYIKTLEHIEDLKKLSQIRNFYHIALPLYLRNAVSQLQPKWVCWNPSDKDIWIRPLPQNSINIKNHNFDFYEKPIEFEEFVPAFTLWYKQKVGGKIAFGIGIRTDESLNRWRTIASQVKETYKDLQWTTLLKLNQKEVKDVYNFYPIYDWKTQDIWGCVSKYNFLFNEIYELMYKNGLSIHEQRLCQPFGDDQKNGLDQYKALEYETWEKLLNRVNGVNFGNIYCRTSALGNIKSCKPDFMNWQQYSVYLLESLGLYNKTLMLHYVEKIKKFLRWHKEKRGCNLEQIPDKADLKLESERRVPSWRRIARAIERNDFYMKRLCFSQNKSDEIKLKEMIKKDNNLIDYTATTDKHLKQFIEREGLINVDRYAKEENKNESIRKQVSLY